jgi:predicted nucleotidyltransferase component of viral defense system
VTIRRLVRTDYELQDAADQQGVSLEDAARDLALLSVMASLADRFGERIISKGGAALRFGHGASRTSRDADATVTQPARAPIPAEEVMEAIASARMGQFLRYTVPREPATANRYSLDVDQIQFACATVEGTLDVELSFREDVVLEPIRLPIGEPYFDRSKS